MEVAFGTVKEQAMGFRQDLSEALRLIRAGRPGQAFQRLRHGSADGTALPASIAAPIASPPPARGLFEARQVSGAEGVMDYHLYRPAHGTTPMPLVVMLHGCTQDPEDFARGTGMNQLADELGFLVAYPRQSQRANPQKCWNWFRPNDQQRNRGEPALLAAVTRAVMADEAADRQRVYVAGLSAGGAAATIMAAQYPDLFAAVGVHSGLPCGAARDVQGALAAMKHGAATLAPVASAPVFVPLITFHGDQDATVQEANSRQIVAQAITAAIDPLQTSQEIGQSIGGRDYTRDLYANADGKLLIEQWTVADAGHAWAGGDLAGSYTDPAGPDASREMLRFFLSHQLPAGG